MRVKGADDQTYYSRRGAEILAKKEAVRKFVLARKDIATVLDIGCNNGDMSHQLMEHGISVLGLDISNNLQIPKGYSFARCDVTEIQNVLLNHCTLFLSLYHHIVCANGLDAADELFYKLLLRTNYLLFDCGNVEEKGIDRQQWIASLKRHFSTERELLDHFGVSYVPIRAWNTAGASRTIVVFRRDSFDQGVQIIDEFRRGIGQVVQKEGLTPISTIEDEDSFYPYTRFYKLRLGQRFFFAKKHRRIIDQCMEMKKLVEVYHRFSSKQLLCFYGISKQFGLVYEWIEQFEYKGKVRAETVHGVYLYDADVIAVDGQVKIIDFAGEF